MSAADAGHEVCSVFFDLSKAFDKVPHALLVRKLLDLHVSHILIKWIYNHLSNRFQTVFLFFLMLLNHVLYLLFRVFPKVLCWVR